ncbi:MAG: hypothetical protein HYS17_02625 [Micavibrio aeruginosavorus]|uniref:Uncharacterized protein n=1 Tax=Micavibrio aeruginosavorus TaxID=349221 RepID=A0A7T5R399_9BACT|nr:MAG: hypothetical protein HYS17_02625 [Micavibrio aeruginosavorus]
MKDIFDHSSVGMPGHMIDVDWEAKSAGKSEDETAAAITRAITDNFDVAGERIGLVAPLSPNIGGRVKSWFTAKP